MKILCFGSLNLDYVYQVDHIVRPGETTAASAYQLYDGGKGLNQAIALGRAGANCWMAGSIGKDGAHLLDSLRKSQVNADLIQISNDRNGHTVIQVDKTGQNSILYFAGANRMMTETYIRQVLDQFDKGDYILLQNEINSVPGIIRLAAEKGLKIAFNPSPISEDLLQYPLSSVDLLVLNEIEGFEIVGEKEPERILQKLHRSYPKTSVLLTLGKKGAVFSDGKSCCRHGIYDVQAIDTTAAGDTFVGYFLTFYARNEPVEECLRIASIASSLTVSRPGAMQSIPILSEVENSSLCLVNK